MTNLIDILSSPPASARGDRGRYGGAGYGQFKTDVGEAVVAVLAPIQARYRELRADPASCSGCWRGRRQGAGRRSRRWRRCTSGWGSSGARPAGSAELRDLGPPELPPLARRKAVDAETRVDAPVQPADAVTDRLAHPPHLAVAALVEHELEAGRAEPADARRRRDAVLELDALREAAQRLVVRLLPGLDLVDLLDAVPRVREPVRERAVVREQEGAGRLDVEPPDRDDARLVLDEVDDRRPPCGSLAVVTTPAGLCSSTYASCCFATGSPSTSTTSRTPRTCSARRARR